MKKYILIIAVAIASLFAYSCTSGSIDREEAPVPAVKLVPLVLNSGVSVKTSLNSDGTVSWSDKDQIAVIDCINEVRPFSSSISEDRTSATFKGNVADGTEQFYAVYPFGSVTAADKSSISVTLPASQNPTPGTFENNLNISVASGSKSPGVEEVNGVKFNNLCGLLKFTMPAELGEIDEVKFIANRPIAGELIISKETMSLLSAGDVNTVSMAGTFAANSTFYFVITPGEISGFSVSVTTSNGVILTKSSENKIQISAGKIKNLGTIPMVVANENLSVAHTTSEGILTGTEVKFTPSIDVNTEFNAELINDASGDVVRSLTFTATGSEFALPAESGKPYIPQGNYTFRYSYTIGSVNYTKSQKVTVPAPTFAVSVSAETSYSLSRTAASKANDDYAGAPMEIRKIKATISGISEAVLNQVGATYSASITEGKTENALAANSASPSTFATYTAKSVGSHTLTAICKFDGVEKTASTPCVITGLPYTADPPTNSGNFKWTGTTLVVSFNKDYVKISADAGSIVPTLSSSIFYAEGNILADIIVNATLESTGQGVKESLFWGDYVLQSSSVGTMVCYLGDTVIGRMYGYDASYLTEFDWKGKALTSKSYQDTFQCTLASGDNTIKIINNSSILPSAPYVYVNQVDLKYR